MPVNEALLDERLAELEKARAWSPRVVSKLEAHIRSADDEALFRINPLTFAAEKHKKQLRKNAGGTPYINHPLAAADLLASDGGVTDVVVLAAPRDPQGQAMLDSFLSSPYARDFRLEGRFADVLVYRRAGS